MLRCCQLGLIRSRRVRKGSVAMHFPPRFICSEACSLLLAPGRLGDGLPHWVLRTTTIASLERDALVSPVIDSSHRLSPPQRLWLSNFGRPLVSPGPVTFTCKDFAVGEDSGIIFLDCERARWQRQRRERICERNIVCHMLDGSVHHKMRSYTTTCSPRVCVCV